MGVVWVCGGRAGAVEGQRWERCGVGLMDNWQRPHPHPHPHPPPNHPPHPHTVQRIGSGALAADTGLAEGRGMADTVVLVREGGGREGVAAIRVHSSVVGQDKGWKKMLFFGAWRGRPGGGGR